MARLHARFFWEKLLVPPFLYFFHFLYPFRKVSNPRSRAAAAAGGCILLRAEVLERIGGLAAIHDAVIDDVALARCVKGAGGRCWLGLDPDIFSIREYQGLGEIARMVARTAFTQLRFRFSLYLATLLFLGLLYVSPPLLAAAGLLCGSPFVTASSLLAWLLQSVTLAPFVIHERVGLAYAVTLPLSALLYAWMTTLSVWRHVRGAGVEWRGRRLTSGVPSSSGT